MDQKVENGGTEEDKGWVWGRSSLAVPSILQILKNDPQSVPERYIKEEKDRALVVDVSRASLQIPIIDFSFLAKGDADERSKLDLACKDWGFFQIDPTTNHGVEEEVLLKMKAAMATFFELPLEEKKKYATTANDFQGYGQPYVVSEQQKLDWYDTIYFFSLPPENRNYKFWPLICPGFKEAVDAYSKEVKRVAEEICASLSVLMGMDRDCLKRLQGKLGIRLNYYPTCSRPDLVLGISPHSDKNLLTLILQGDEISGLQIKQKQEWILVEPIPGCFLVNIGDSTEILSNGMYKSIEHRVITNEKKPRMSVAAFVYPDDQVEFGPLESMVDETYRPRMYRNIKFMDYMRQGLARKWEGETHTDLVKLESK